MGKIIESYYGERTAQIDPMWQKELQLPEDTKYIGQRGLPPKDGYVKADGTAVFVRDVYVPGMLYAKQLQSKYAHAKIKSMDTRKAEALPGVRGIIRYDDPEAVFVGDPSGKVGEHSDTYWTPVSPLGTECTHYNQPMAVAVAADTQEIADQALRLIEIEWEELPQETDWNEAMKDEVILQPEFGDSNIVSDNTIEYGDVEAGFAEADHIIEWRIERKENTCICVEPMLYIAKWEGEYLTTWSKAQMTTVSKAVAFPDIPLTKISINIPFQGATFGGSVPQTWAYGTFPRLAVEMAKKTNKPVKLLFDEHFYGHDFNTGTYIMKAGFKNDGTITAVDGEFRVVRNGLYVFIDIKKQTCIKNLRERMIDVNDSRGAGACHRDGGDIQLVANSLFNRVAAYLEMDPTELALKNNGSEGKTWEELQEWRNAHFLEPNRNSLKECIDIAKEKIDWNNKYHAPGAKKLPNGRYHGIGFLWAHEWSLRKWSSSAAIYIERDGTARIVGQLPSFGCNNWGTYSQIVADEIGMKYEDVQQRCSVDDNGYFMGLIGGSAGTISNTPTLVKCARKAKRMILELACQPYYSDYFLPKFEPPTPSFPKEPGPADFPGKTWQELDIKDSIIFEKANPSNKKTIREVMERNVGYASIAVGNEPVVVDDFTGQIDYRHPGCYQCHMVEVEVDPDTGQVYITKVVNVNDVGKALTPDSLNGQQYGGSYMGLGTANMEEVYYDPMTGVKMNDDLEGYHIALMNDIGPVDCNLVETRQGYGAYGTCGIGENIAATLYYGVADAIYNAIGKWVDVQPSTPDRVLKALGKI